MGKQPILSITVPVRMIKGAARQRYGDGVVRCEQALKWLMSIKDFWGVRLFMMTGN